MVVNALSRRAHLAIMHVLVDTNMLPTLKTAYLWCWVFAKVPSFVCWWWKGCPSISQRLGDLLQAMKALHTSSNEEGSDVQNAASPWPSPNLSWWCVVVPITEPLNTSYVLPRNRQRFGFGLTGLALSKPNRFSLNKFRSFKHEPNLFGPNRLGSAWANLNRAQTC